MAELLLHPKQKEISNGITEVHHVGGNSELEYVEFKVLDVSQGAKYSETLEGKECCIVALRGKLNVSDGETRFEDVGSRESVFERKPTDSVYVSNDRTFEIEAVTTSRVALCYSKSDRQLPTKLIKAADNSIEHRGAHSNKRTVHNILPDSDSSANSLLVVEVYTDAGNWSSYPPHKHDEDNLPSESFLEETYYHEMDPPQGFVFQRVYTDDQSLDETMTVKSGDVVMVPKGYHPVGVPDGYTSYYLNVMAGPKRIWRFHNDSDHAWMLERQ